MSFALTTTSVIKNSILSSLYVDDKIVQPFEDRTNENASYFDVSKGLYESFRAENKSLDFYRFPADKKWKKESDYIFKNQDLLVLDWQLDDSKGLRQVDTLQLLQAAVETENLHFVSIYTETPASEFDDIFYQIKAHFEFAFDKDTNSRI